MGTVFVARKRGVSGGRDDTRQSLTDTLIKAGVSTSGEGVWDFGGSGCKGPCGGLRVGGVWVCQSTKACMCSRDVFVASI